MLKLTELPGFPQFDKTKETWELIKKEMGRFWDRIDPDVDSDALTVSRVNVIEVPAPEVEAFGDSPDASVDVSVVMSETYVDPAMFAVDGADISTG